MKKLMCYLFGHNYEHVSNYNVSIGDIGTGIVTKKKCSRCGSETLSVEVGSTISYDTICDTFGKKEITIHPITEKTSEKTKRGRPPKA